MNAKSAQKKVESLQSPFYEFPIPTHDVKQEVLEGLSQDQKTLSPKYFYDEEGSEMFNQITETPEYYVTRTELSILRKHIHSIIESCGENAFLIEYGSGASEKIRILLDHLPSVAGLLSLDISKEELLKASQRLQEDYPDLHIISVSADYTKPLPLLDLIEVPHQNRVAFFPGSTIGNFQPEEAKAFLVNIRESLGEGGQLLIGADLQKDRDVLENAYNDQEGITASFNKNILKVLNREVDSNFQAEKFKHKATYNNIEHRIEMHLVSQQEQTVELGDQKIDFSRGETIHTENSHKFTIEGFQEFARECGFQPVNVWTDSNEWFSVHLLSVA